MISSGKLYISLVTISIQFVQLVTIFLYLEFLKCESDHEIPMVQLVPDLVLLDTKHKVLNIEKDVVIDKVC
jgi:hypothetical protein